jgi:uncharacterized protein (TIGR03083 family)
MSAATTNIWESIRSNRLALADQMETLSDARANCPSWCEGWRVRDVLGHLVHLAESTRTSMLLDGLRSGTPNRTLNRAAHRLGERSVPELCERLRRSADGRFRVPGVPLAVGLGEVVVHGNDALRPIGSTFGVSPDDSGAVLDAYRRIARLRVPGQPLRLAFRSKDGPRIRLVASDREWSWGRGPEVHGKAVDLVLLLAGRRQVIPHLAGEGNELLASD